MLRRHIFGNLRKFICVATIAIPAIGHGADCSMTSVGSTPINDLGSNTYLGFQGGLYPNGSNLRPANHESAGLTLAQSIDALNSNGNADPNGKYVLLSIGMSNTSQEFTAFMADAESDPDKDTDLVVVNGAQGGATASDWANSSNPVWSGALQALSQKNVNANQVAVVWIKLANGAGRQPTDTYRNQLQSNIEDAVKLLPGKFPNLKLVYFSSRIYAGYASSDLNPEPYAYESGFVVKWIVEKQLGGDPSLNFDPTNGPVSAPWLSWGPYLWADGLMPRSDGLTWECGDVRDDDGTHPSTAGQRKVASLLLDFFKSDATAREWYLNDSPQNDTVAPAPPQNLTVDP